MHKNNILRTIADHAAVRVQAARSARSLEEIRAEALALNAEENRLYGQKKEMNAEGPEAESSGVPVLPPFAFEQALRFEDMAFICECKKASPSKGLIAPDFPYLEIARDYEAAGASCISVLTEPKWFLGENHYLQEIAEAVHIPCLRKDFIIDEYMLYEARLLKASAALLIVSLLEEDTLRRYIKICDELGMSALVEAHDEQEVRTAMRADARIIGINNRNLKDFSVDFENSRRLRSLVPKDILFVAESGVRSGEDIKVLRDIGADAVLIGETLMRAADKKAMLDELRGGRESGA